MAWFAGCISAWTGPRGVQQIFEALRLVPLVWASGYFGSSLGFLGRDANGGWGWAWLAARRFMIGTRSQVISVASTMSVAGVALGVWLVMVALAVLSGFEHDLATKIVGAHGDIIVERLDGGSFELSSETLHRLEQQKHVTSLAPVVGVEVAAASRSNFAGARLYGIDPAGAPQTLRVLKHLEAGELRDLTPGVRADLDTEDPYGFPVPAVPDGVVIGAQIAHDLSVEVGDVIRVVSATAQVLTPAGLVPRSVSLRVVGLFNSGMYDYDSGYLYAHADVVRRFARKEAGCVTAIHLLSDDPETSLITAQGLSDALPEGTVARDWTQRNSSLFAALKLERSVAMIVLTFVILVASFSIVTTLTMSILERKGDIATLKTMGASNSSVVRVFLLQGILLGGAGLVLGVVLGLASIWALDRFGLAIPSDVYYIPSLPVAFSWADGVPVVFAALLIVWNFSVFPAVRGSQFRPVEGLRG